MSDSVITVEGLSKRYRLGARNSGERYTALRDVLADKAKSIFRRNGSDANISESQRLSVSKEDFWALKDVSFAVKHGEVVGIIGRNGAGKSTLLKILSRITEPTEGKVRIRGRVASLLEVGTGFHPELTGRENIYLNGAILGMTKAEIKSKFDEIVTFAEVEKFLDTPVKRYSSGMYVRLAFAVAAHLEPEILIVDEVLAVGDAEFQAKCLGKMGQVARAGRTIIFVSHNTDAILRLCSTGISLATGSIVDAGNIVEVVSGYLSDRTTTTGAIDLSTCLRSIESRGSILLELAKLKNESAPASWIVPFGTPLSFGIGVFAHRKLFSVELAVALLSASGFELASSLSTHTNCSLNLGAGYHEIQVDYRNLRLTPGSYYVSLALRSTEGLEDYLERAFHFEISSSGASAQMKTDILKGAIVPDVSFLQLS